MSARAAQEAARAVFAFSSGTTPSDATTSPEWHATTSPLNSPRLRSDALWRAAEQILQTIVGNASFTGHALITEARKQERVTLDDAHALVSLFGWYEQIHQPTGSHASEHVDLEQPPSAFEQRVAREVWLALDHAVDSTEAPTAPIASTTPATDRRVELQSAVRADARTDARGDAVVHSTVRAAGTDTRNGINVLPPKRSVSSAVILSVIGVVLVASALTWRLLVGQGDKAFLDGVLAYDRGANEVARIAFIKAAAERPNDPAPLVYLGRLARDERDVVKAKEYLYRAIKMSPPNAIAMREMASTLLLEGQPELARRFYVRAVELDPRDKLAQGFLGCALQRLGRSDEAARWGDRAGPGEWTACIETPTTSASAPAPPAPRTPGKP